MIVVAVLNINTEVLQQTSDDDEFSFFESFEREMSWSEESGINLNSYVVVNELSQEVFTNIDDMLSDAFEYVEEEPYEEVC